MEEKNESLEQGELGDENPNSSLIPWEQVLEEEEPTIFEGISPEKKVTILGAIRKVESITMSVSREMIQHSGPLPHPSTFAKYGEVVPDAPERILSQFEKQSNHRMEMEKKVITGQLKQSETGQWMGFLIGIFLIIVAFILILLGHDVSGSILGTVDIIGLVSVFVIGKRKQRESLKEKSED